MFLEENWWLVLLSLLVLQWQCSCSLYWTFSPSLHGISFPLQAWWLEMQWQLLELQWKDSAMISKSKWTWYVKDNSLPRLHHVRTYLFRGDAGDSVFVSGLHAWVLICKMDTTFDPKSLGVRGWESILDKNTSISPFIFVVGYLQLLCEPNMSFIAKSN